MRKQAEWLPDRMPSPFGGFGQKCQTMSTAEGSAMYRRKCGADISAAFGGIAEICQYRCSTTGYLFWRPEEVAGDEAFYRTLSAAWRNYYRTDRWEYAAARSHLRPEMSVLEIGCGPGHFLRSIEGKVRQALGIEFNSDAIENKVTSFPMARCSIESLATQRSGQFQVCLAFQVLEHVTDPAAFIRSALACLSDGGLLIMSTPNHDHESFRNQEDAFDLPPHHVGHFTRATYEVIADLLGVRVVEIAIQEEASGIMRNLRKAFRPATVRPGPNIMVVYRK